MLAQASRPELYIHRPFIIIRLTLASNLRVLFENDSLVSSGLKPVGHGQASWSCTDNADRVSERESTKPYRSQEEREDCAPHYRKRKKKEPSLKLLWLLHRVEAKKSGGLEAWHCFRGAGRLFNYSGTGPSLSLCPEACRSSTRFATTKDFTEHTGLRKGFELHVDSCQYQEGQGSEAILISIVVRLDEGPTAWATATP